MSVVTASQNDSRLEKATIGFWLYLMTDCVLFGTLFATYFVLRGNTFGGPGPKELFHSSTVLIETLVLLVSSYSAGIALIRLRQKETIRALFWLAVTFALGAVFLGIEINEFISLAQSGNSWTRSGFLSAFFTLVATHGAHITAGLLWIVVLAIQIIQKNATPNVVRRFTLFSMFWHFLDVVWIFIFSTVYLLGVA